MAGVTGCLADVIPGTLDAGSLDEMLNWLVDGAGTCPSCKVWSKLAERAEDARV